MPSDYYTYLGKIVYNGDVANADDLNTVNTAVDAAFEQVETDIDTIIDESQFYSTRAQEWAENAYGVEVMPGQYSALHWATDAADSASAASDSETAASNSADAAATSETNAAASEDTCVAIQGELEQFDSVADMVSSPLEVGRMYSTIGYYTAGDGGGAKYFITTGSADGYVDHSVNGGVNIAKLSVDVPNVKQCGAKGDGTGDDGLSFNAAFSKLAEVKIPAGTYAITTNIIQNDCNVKGEATHLTVIESNQAMTGFLWTVQGLNQAPVILKDLSMYCGRGFSNDTWNQSGLQDLGIVDNDISGLKIHGFDKTAMRVGDKAQGYGSYWASYRNISLLCNSAQSAEIGLIVDATDGDFPNSNDSVFINFRTSGRFAKHMVIGGNNHTFINGTCEGTVNTEDIDWIYYITGSNNKFLYPYNEFGANAPNLAYFGEESFGNEIREMFTQYYPKYSIGDSVTDLGVNNRVTSSDPVGNFSHPSINDRWSENLWLNSDFKALRASNTPWGFTVLNGSWSLDYSDVVNGAYASLVATSTGTNVSTSVYLEESTASSSFKWPLEMFKGKEVFFGVWVKSDMPGAGYLSFTAASPSGNQNLASTRCTHSGSGEWEYLSMLANVKDDATLVFCSLRTYVSDTGYCKFCCPEIRTREAKFKTPMYPDKAIITGDTLRVNQGTNGLAGRVQITGGSVTVNNTNCRDDSIVLITRHQLYGTPGHLSARATGGSFTISSTTTETSLINYFIIQKLYD